MEPQHMYNNGLRLHADTLPLAADDDVNDIDDDTAPMVCKA